jgi:hypothetical protein
VVADRQLLSGGACSAFYDFLRSEGYTDYTASRYRRVFIDLISHRAISGEGWRLDLDVELAELRKWRANKPNCSKVAQLAQLDSISVINLLDAVRGAFSEGYQQLLKPVVAQIHAWLNSLRGITEASIPSHYVNLKPNVPYLLPDQVRSGISEFARDFQPEQLRGKLAVALIYRAGVRPGLICRVNRAAHDDVSKTLRLVDRGRAYSYQLDSATHANFMAVLAPRSLTCCATTPVFSENGDGFRAGHLSWYIRQFFRSVNCPVDNFSSSPSSTLWFLGAAHRISSEGCTKAAVQKEMDLHGLVSEEVRRQLIASAKYFMPSRELKLPPQF